MPSRRAFLASLAAMISARPSAAQDRYDQAALLATWPFGNVTLMHLGDLCGQFAPHYKRAPQQRVALAREQDHPPHLTGEAFRIRYGIGGQTPLDYAHTHEDFVAQAGHYGPMGGIDRVATIVDAIRADVEGAVLLSAGGNAPGSHGSLQSTGADVGTLLQVLGCKAAGLGSELTLGAKALAAQIRAQGFPVLAQNVSGAEGVLPYIWLEQAGHKIAVIGQGVSNPGQIYPVRAVPDFEFDLGLEGLGQTVQALRGEGAAMIVVLSQNGFVKDLQLARSVNDIDLILSGGDHVVTPEPEVIGKTHVIASGSQGRFVSRIDVEIDADGVQGIQHQLIPVFSDLIRADPEITEIAGLLAQPYAVEDAQVLGTADALLTSGGTFGGTWDDVIGEALLRELEAEIAFFPGFAQGRTVLPGHSITRADIVSVTGHVAGQSDVAMMTGAQILAWLEAAAEEVFALDPFERSGLRMMRASGVSFSIAPDGPPGARISKVSLFGAGRPLEADQEYRVASWGLPSMPGLGADITQIVARHIEGRGRVDARRTGIVKVLR